ncbi:MAG: NUDIX domain-containing protein [bacterium]|nr:NUDIX domain-containing protein [bacterium]
MTTRMNKAVRTADVIALYRGKLVLVKRLKAPFGLALPGGHVDPGETPKETAIREFLEEVGLTLHGAKFFTERKGKRRDPRYRMSKTRVYIGNATGKPKNEKGHTEVVLMELKKAQALPKEEFAFDHWAILKKYFEQKGR